jgi:PIN domain nuclease of toxin-antitoxin system
VTGAAVSTWQAVRATRAEDVATKERDLATEAESEANRKRQEAEAAQDQARTAEQSMRRQWYAATIHAMPQVWDTGQVPRLRALYVQTNPQMSATAVALLTNPANDLFLSVASAWELAIKSGLKKLALFAPLTAFLAQGLAGGRILLLPVTLDDCAAYEQLPFPNPRHHGPFDRMLVIDAQRQGLSLVSADAAFDAYGVPRLW